MQVVELGRAGSEIALDGTLGRSGVRTRVSADPQRTFLLLLATVWLLDAVLQLQPFMFTPGANGFSGMLDNVAGGNTGWIAHTGTWAASIVDHHPVLTNTFFALFQFLIGFGIVAKRTCKAALAFSVAWSLAVWWFGEGAGGVFSGGATPFGGGPGGVLFYAVLAVLLWPSERPDGTFVAARTFGERTSKVVWVAVWGILAVLSVVGSGRSPKALAGLISAIDSGQPGWLAHLDRSSEALFLHHGTTLAIVLCVICAVVALGVFAPAQIAQATLVLAIVVFAIIWVAVENFGGILAGGATDPNSGPLVILLALTYWPRNAPVRTEGRTR
jgi:hypothetical protein